MTETKELEFRGNKLPVTAAPGIDIDTCLSASVFTSWKSKVEADERLQLNAVHFQSLDMFGRRVGFMKLKSDIQDNTMADKSIRIPGIVFLRGGAVAMLIVLVCGEKEYVVLTVQPRVPIGSARFEEIPAGMLDGDGNFAGVAAKELREETGLSIAQDSLSDMSQMAFGSEVEGMYPSSGGCDEFIRIFAYKTEVSQDELSLLQGRHAGLLEEGENIALKIIPMDDLWKVPDAKALSALSLYNKLKDKIPIQPNTLDLKQDTSEPPSKKAKSG